MELPPGIPRNHAFARETEAAYAAECNANRTRSAPTKRCSRCGQVLPATTEHWYRNGAVLHCRCKDCHKALQRARNAANPRRSPRGQDIANLRARGLRRCSRCRIVLPNSPTYFTTTPRGYGGTKSWCRECDRADKNERNRRRREATAS